MGGDECTPAGSDGWIGRRWTDRRIDGWMDRYTDRPIGVDGQIHTYRAIYGWMKGWTDRWTGNK